jgi:hypothetical protein
MEPGGEDVDAQFYERADAHIHLSNDQLAVENGRGKVSASMMYATARFNAWVSACGFSQGKEMASAREEIVAYFVEQYRQMLEENLDDYIANFSDYMRTKPQLSVIDGGGDKAR